MTVESNDSFMQRSTIVQDTLFARSLLSNLEILRPTVAGAEHLDERRLIGGDYRALYLMKQCEKRCSEQIQKQHQEKTVTEAFVDYCDGKKDEEGDDVVDEKAFSEVILEEMKFKKSDRFSV